MNNKVKVLITGADGFIGSHEMIRVGDLANILGTPAGKTHKKLTKLSFEILGDPFQPFICKSSNKLDF